MQHTDEQKTAHKYGKRITYSGQKDMCFITIQIDTRTQHENTTKTWILTAETRSSLIGSGQLKEFKELASEHADCIPTPVLATQYTCTYKEEQDGHCRFTPIHIRCHTDAQQHRALLVAPSLRTARFIFPCWISGEPNGFATGCFPRTSVFPY